MEIAFKCPECRGHALVELTDEEVTEIRQQIAKQGRSPTLIVRCEKGHELLVTLSNIRTGDGFCVRDVTVARRKEGRTGSKSDETKDVDWLIKAFGGEE